MKRTKAQISFNMSCIRSRGTRIEKIFASALRRKKIKFRRYFPIPGKPDFVLPSKKIAIFCDSSFWHGYKKMSTPRHYFKQRKRFWTKKILCNIERDKEVNNILKKEGWKVIRFWDFQINGGIDKCISQIKMLLH